MARLASPRPLSVKEQATAPERHEAGRSDPDELLGEVKRLALGAEETQKSVGGHRDDA
jgi:hypothetical protein